MAWISWSSAARAAFAKDGERLRLQPADTRVDRSLSFFFSRSPLHTGGGGIRFARPVLNPTIGSSPFFFCFSSPHPPHLHLPLFFPGTVTEFQRRPSCRARELLRLPETRRTISPKQRPANGHETHASLPVFFSRSIFVSRSLERITLRE